MKIKATKGKWSLKPKLGISAVFFSCCFFFLAGLFASNLIFLDTYGGRQRARARQLQSVKEEIIDYDLLPPGKTGDDSLTVIPFQVLSWKPRALYFPNFATAEQCQSIINMAKPNLKPSTLALRKGETEENTKGIRTSSGMFINGSEDESGLLDAIEEKIARATMLPKVNGEAFNILLYEIGQKYSSHYDAFNPAEYGPQKSQRTFIFYQKLSSLSPKIAENFDNIERYSKRHLQSLHGLLLPVQECKICHKNRALVASFLLYLSDVEEGGETMFPLENGLDSYESYGFNKCTGYRVKPRRGDGLLLYSLFPNNTIDATSLHGSCPVIKGEKWVATKWIRDQEFDE